MWNLVKLEIFKLKKVLIITLVISTIGCVILPLIHSKGYQYYASIEIWEQCYGIILFFFPLIVTLPICWLMYYERKDKFISYNFTRVRKHKYLFAKLLTHCSYGFLITFCVSFFIAVISVVFLFPVIAFW